MSTFPRLSLTLSIPPYFSLFLSLSLSLYIYIYKVKLVTVIEGNQKAPFSIATTLRYYSTSPLNLTLQYIVLSMAASSTIF